MSIITITDGDFLKGIQAGYLECAEWADAPEGAEHEGFSAYSIENANRDCAAFFAANKDDLRATRIAPEYLGHDFWLTRNHHGAGFWDRGLGDLGEALTQAAHAFGELYLVVGDDNQLHIEG